MIDKVVTSAQESAEQHFDPGPDANIAPGSSLVHSEQVALPEDVKQVTVDLGDGRQARVSLPEDL